METLHPLIAYRQSQTPPLSQEGLAKKLGKPKGTVSRWEAGRLPDKDELPNITEVTGIPAHVLRPDLAALLMPARAKRRRSSSARRSRAA